jgi:hypothetical protein
VLARGLEEVGDFEDVAGDLQVAVAVHGVRWFLGGRVREDGGALVGREEGAAGSGGPGRRPERAWLNSRNSDSYSERGQHRGTRRCGSR